MRVLQTYDLSKLLADILPRGWSIADTHRAVNDQRKKAGQAAISYYAVQRVLAGTSQKAAVIVAIAAALGTTEAKYRAAAAPTRRRRARASA